MIIYADMVFIINILMNSLILLITAWVIGLRYKVWRIILAAIIGSCYVLISMLPHMAISHMAICKILMSLLLVLVAFGVQTRRAILLQLGTFYLVAFILGGAVAGWVFFLQDNSLLHTFSLESNSLSSSGLLWGSCVGTFFIVVVIRRIVIRNNLCPNLYQIKIEYEGRSVGITALLDTGNGLYTTISRKPVVLVSQDAVESILSEDVLSFLRANTPEMWLPNLDQCTDLNWLSRTQIIPYHAIGRQSMLLAFRSDHLIIAMNNNSIDVKDVVIAIYSRTLSGDGTYAALLHPQIINELYKNEGASICA
jgi:stage II sporulation protein GA (sporulation sigma-E factor processing peptidase)